MNIIIKIFLSLTLIFSLNGCFSTRLPIQDISEIDKDVMKQVYQIKTYYIGQNVPEIKEFLGSVSGYSCRSLTWEKRANAGDALIQLKLNAHKLGADGILDITFDNHGTDAWSTNCWEGVAATGMAVKFKK